MLLVKFNVAGVNHGVGSAETELNRVRDATMLSRYCPVNNTAHRSAYVRLPTSQCTATPVSVKGSSTHRRS